MYILPPNQIQKEEILIWLREIFETDWVVYVYGLLVMTKKMIERRV